MGKLKLKRIENIALILESFWLYHKDSLKTAQEIGIAIKELQEKYKGAKEYLEGNGAVSKIEHPEKHVKRLFRYFTDAMYQSVANTKQVDTVKEAIKNTVGFRNL